MTTFDHLMEPVVPILAEIEQERVPHFNETHPWPLFVRVLVYHFTMGYTSMRELVTGLCHADAALVLPALPRSTMSQMFTRFDSDLLRCALVRLLATLPLPENPELALLGTIYLVDGSYFPTLHHVIWENAKMSQEMSSFTSFLMLPGWFPPLLSLMRPHRTNVLHCSHNSRWVSRM